MSDVLAAIGEALSALLLLAGACLALAESIAAARSSAQISSSTRAQQAATPDPTCSPETYFAPARVQRRSHAPDFRRVAPRGSNSTFTMDG